MHTIHRLTFDLPLKRNQASAFRGAIIKTMDGNAHPLMHNHEVDGLRFSYPQVQYKSIDQKASIVAFDEMGELLKQHFEQTGPFMLKLGNKEHSCRLERYTMEDYVPLIGTNPLYYNIVGYLPLTESNVKEYHSLMSLTDKVCLIEKILTGNILSFLKGLDLFADQQIVCAVCSIEKEGTIKYKKVPFHAFDLHFVSNIYLPDFIGLGKSPSVGMGTIVQHPLPERFKAGYSSY